MFFYSSTYRQDVRVDEYVVFLKTHRLSKCYDTFCNLNLSLVGVGLTFFIGEHQDNLHAESVELSSSSEEFRLAFFQRYGVDDRFHHRALHSENESVEVGRVYHRRRESH